ncbi:MAG: cbb3-type cytochrome oxidase assembly protein CcoS [Thermodesulfobacteriota bacterium]
MLIILLTISISLILATVFVVAFIWSAKSGQYDDLVTPAHRALLDDSEKINKKEKKNKEDNIYGDG